MVLRHDRTTVRWRPRTEKTSFFQSQWKKIVTNNNNIIINNNGDEEEQATLRGAEEEDEERYIFFLESHLECARIPSQRLRIMVCP